jgi:hypothetical protein
MRAKVLLVILVVCTVGLLAVWWFGRTPTQLPPKETGQTTTEDLPKPKLGAAKKNNVVREFDKTSKSLSVQERLEELARNRGVSLNVLTQEMIVQVSNMVQEMSQTVNRPIEFYGKVVDGSETPMEAAKVEFGCVVYPEGSFNTNGLSDASGFFGLSSVTGAVLFVNVSKEGYVQGTNQNRFEYYSPGDLGSFRPDSNNPVIFHLQRKP